MHDIWLGTRFSRSLHSAKNAKRNTQQAQYSYNHTTTVSFFDNHEIKMIDRVNFSMTIMNDIWKTHLLHFKRHSNLLNISIKFILFLTLCYNDHFMHLSQICMLKDIHVN